MIDLKLLEKTDSTYCADYKACLKNRSADPSVVDQLLEMNKQRKQLIAKSEELKSQQNKVSAEVAKLKKSGGDSSSLIAEMQTLVKSIKEMETQATEADQKVKDVLLTLPNMCHSSVPVGASSDDNFEVRKWGEPTKFGFKPLDHGDLGEKLGIIDFERAGKVTGARFTFLKGQAAQLERALINFMLNLHTREHGYQEILPPFIINSKSLTGTGQLPKFKADLFHLTDTDYFLAPTAEVPVTNYYNDEILKEEDLPICYSAYTPCFRSEAGSYGKDVKGLIRQHQFNKVELVKFTTPEISYDEHEKLVRNAEEVLKRLGLPHRTMCLCTGDIGFGAAKCYDLEVWLPGQNAYREISSCSNYEDFQARRANIRYRPKAGGKPQFVHTLNGSGLAVGRTLVAIFENYQREDGSIAIPEVLQPYMDGAKSINAYRQK